MRKIVDVTMYIVEKKEIRELKLHNIESINVRKRENRHQ